MDYEIVTEGLRFPEGPIWMEDGSVIVVEIAAGRLTRVRPNGAKETVANLGGGPNGAAIGPDGRVYVCNNGGFAWTEHDGLLFPGRQPEDYSGGRIEAVDLATGLDRLRAGGFGGRRSGGGRRMRVLLEVDLSVKGRAIDDGNLHVGQRIEFVGEADIVKVELPVIERWRDEAIYGEVVASAIATRIEANVIESTGA